MRPEPSQVLTDIFSAPVALVARRVLRRPVPAGKGCLVETTMLEVFDERAIALSRRTRVAHLSNVERRRSLGNGCDKDDAPPSAGPAESRLPPVSGLPSLATPVRSSKADTRMIRVHTLGGLAVRGGDGKPVVGSGAQPRRMAILALLARAGERGTSRDRILGLLWPDADDERGARSLTQAIYALRKDLSTEEVITGAKELRLEPGLAS